MSEPATETISPRERISNCRLYLCCNAREPAALEDLLTGAVEGGVDVIQLREKSADRDRIEKAAEVFRAVAGRTGALFVLNDEPELALEVGADGVHLGQEDSSPERAREILGERPLIGLSTHRTSQLEWALADPDIDYFSVGPVWKTPTKPGRPPAGLDYVSSAAAVGGDRPWFAIGGIDSGNLVQVLERGATRICVVRAIADADDPCAAARCLKDALER